jgi:hypothetical protein
MRRQARLKPFVFDSHFHTPDPHTTVGNVCPVTVTICSLLFVRTPYLLHGAESFLRRKSRNSPHLTEPDGSLPHSQVPATSPYPVGCTKVSVQVRGKCLFSVTKSVFTARCCKHLAQHPVWRIISCRLSVTGYLTNSQLLPISGGCPFHLQAADTKVTMVQLNTQHSTVV